MALDVHIEARPDHLYVTLVGQVTRPASKESIVEIGEAALNAELPRILVDWRPVVNIRDITIQDRFEAASLLADEVAEMRLKGLRGIRIANVTTEIRADAEEFSANVAANRGVDMLITTSMDEARRWLGIADGG